MEPDDGRSPDAPPDVERRPAIGSLIVHKLTKQTVIVLDHEGAVNASPWFTIRDAGMLTHRMRIEEIETVLAQSGVQEGTGKGSGQYL